MTNIRLGNGTVMTKPFYKFLIEEAHKEYGEDTTEKVVLDTVEYTRVNDSDQPGICETATFSMTDGRKFEAQMLHKLPVYCRFREADC